MVEYKRTKSTESLYVMSDAADNFEVIEIALEEAFQSRPVNTQIFRPFLISRLMEHPAVVENTLEYQVQLQDVGEPGTRSVTVKWTWTEEMIPAGVLAVQPEDVTEWAACALAFAIVSNFTEAQMNSVARRSERYDYVFAENGVLCGVEVSGSQTEDRQVLRDRHLQKIRQLLANPRRWGGYVVIVGFARREVWLSHHEAEERTG